MDSGAVWDAALPVIEAFLPALGIAAAVSLVFSLIRSIGGSR